MISAVEPKRNESLSQSDFHQMPSLSPPKGKQFLVAAVWTLIAAAVFICMLEIGFRVAHVVKIKSLR